MKQTEFSFDASRLITWVYRAFADPKTNKILANSELAFAALHSLSKNLFDWPENVERAIEEDRKINRSFSESMNLLKTLGASCGANLGLSQANALLQGYAAACECDGELEFLAEQAKKGLERKATRPTEDMDEWANELPTRRIHQLKGLLGLSPLQVDLIHLSRIQFCIPEFSIFIKELVSARAQSPICALLGCSKEELQQALDPSGALAVYQFFEEQVDMGVRSSGISKFWLDLIENEQALKDIVYEPLEQTENTGMLATLSAEDEKTAHDILIQAKNKKKAGVNLMVYGAENLDKHKALYRTIYFEGNNELQAYSLKSGQFAKQDLSKALLLAQKIIAQKDSLVGTKSVLIVDNAAAILRSTSGFNSILSMFGLPAAAEVEQLTKLERVLLEQNEIPVIWLANEPSELNGEMVARFFFHCPVRKATRAERELHLHQKIQALSLTEDQKKALIGFEGLSEISLKTAIEVASLTASSTQGSGEFYDSMMQALKRSRQAMSRQKLKGQRQSVTKYDLNLINYSGRFGPHSILKALSLKPHGTLALYGIPGTGKTQFAEHIAQTLGKPLISKRGSDLLDKYVGETEKLISQMFEQAETEEAVLLLDEGDSFLRQRDSAQASWEVSRTNELLQKMEQFDGVFILCTNLIDSIDSAALRRFTFKLEFKPLTHEQRFTMFVNEAMGGVPPGSEQQAEQYQEKLAFLRDLSAGDFATVKRQCQLLGEHLTPEQWLEQLALEVAMKSRSRKPYPPSMM